MTSVTCATSWAYLLYIIRITYIRIT